VGPMVLDGLLAAPLANRSNFELSTGFRFGSRNLLITYHPETLLADWGISGFESLLRALERTECNVLFTHPNADAGRDQLLARLEAFIRRNPKWSWAVPSLGQQRYLDALHLFEAMAGNSSSGVIEAPLLGMPVLNIGDRQTGRIQHETVQNVSCESNAIKQVLEDLLKARARSEWRKQSATYRSVPAMEIVSWLLE